MTKVNNVYSTNNLVNLVYSSTSSAINITTEIPFDDTIPQQTEGQEILTATITPKSASNLLIIHYVGVTQNYDSAASGNAITCALFQDATANALAATNVQKQYINPMTLIYSMTAGTTSSTTFKIRVGKTPGKNNGGINQDAGNVRLFGGTSNTSLTIYEYSV